jgi:hypothetical protein
MGFRGRSNTLGPSCQNRYASGRSSTRHTACQLQRDDVTWLLDFVTTMLDAGVSFRDVQIAARHADPRTTMRYDRARKNLDRHPNYILAAYMASGT